MAAPRAYWKGYLKLSLVTCPVALYPASSQSEKTRFHQINRKTGNRLRRLAWWRETTKAAATNSNVAAMLRLSRRNWRPLKSRARARSTSISSCLTRRSTSGYYERPYYIVPDAKSGEEAFAVIRDAMKDKGRVAVARIVFANREHILAIEPWGKGMLGTTLRYDYEIRDEKKFFKGIPSLRLKKDMVELAGHILDRKAGHFDPGEFKDEYELALRKLVKRKAAGHTIEAPEEQPAPTNVINLMDALRESMKRKTASARSSNSSKSRSRATRRKTTRRKAS